MKVFEYLNKIPNIMSYSLILVGMLAIVIIALRGKLVAKWGKNSIGIGESPSETSNESSSERDIDTAKVATTILKIPKRGCGDCILIIMAQREKYELDISITENKRLKQCMIYVEQKLVDMLNLLNDIFSNAMNSSKANKLSYDNSYDLQYKMFYGLMRDSLIQVKDELRRSIKENGFYELNETEFSNYVKDKNKKIVSLVVNYIRTIYPTSGVAVEGMNLIADIEFNSTKFQEILFDIFLNSKKVILDVDIESKKLKESFSLWVDNFIK